MKKKDFSLAHHIYISNQGSHFLMSRNVDETLYAKYKSLKIPKRLEKEWSLKELNRLKKSLANTNNNKLIDSTISLICQYILNTKDYKEIEFLFKYIKNKRPILDSNTIYGCILNILDLAEHLDNKSKTIIITKCIDILNDELTKGITISNDYMENGTFPDYLSLEKLKNNISKTIKLLKNQV